MIGKFALVVAVVALALASAALAVALTHHDVRYVGPTCTERSVYACP